MDLNAVVQICRALDTDKVTERKVIYKVLAEGW